MTTAFQFTNQTVFQGAVFVSEIQGAGLDSILSHYSYDQDTDILDVVFTQDLTAQEETDLNALVAAHPEGKWILEMALADYRWTRETSGILSQGYGIDTTDRSKALINGAYNWIKDQATPTALMDFKTGSGWQSLQHSTIEAIALDVADHVRKCFHAEKETSTKIWDGTLTTSSAVITEFETQYASA